MTNKERLVKFIKDNNLSFNEGKRNTNLTVICGFADYIDASEEDVTEAITETCPDVVWNDEMIFELERTYEYANENFYGNWWNSVEAKKMWEFDEIISA